MPVLLAVLAGCSSTVELVSDPGKLSGLAFLQPGVTTKREVEARLGPPRQIYVSDHVTTYWLNEGKGRYEAGDGPLTGHNLVLLFDADGVLERWSLIRK